MILFDNRYKRLAVSQVNDELKIWIFDKKLKKLKIKKINAMVLGVSEFQISHF